MELTNWTNAPKGGSYFTLELKPNQITIINQEYGKYKMLESDCSFDGINGQKNIRVLDLGTTGRFFYYSIPKNKQMEVRKATFNKENKLEQISSRIVSGFIMKVIGSDKILVINNDNIDVVDFESGTSKSFALTSECTKADKFAFRDKVYCMVRRDDKTVLRTVDINTGDTNTILDCEVPRLGNNSRWYCHKDELFTLDDEFLHSFDTSKNKFNVWQLKVSSSAQITGICSNGTIVISEARDKIFFKKGLLTKRGPAGIKNDPNVQKPVKKAGVKQKSIYERAFERRILKLKFAVNCPMTESDLINRLARIVQMNDLSDIDQTYFDKSPSEWDVVFIRISTKKSVLEQFSDTKLASIDVSGYSFIEDTKYCINIHNWINKSVKNVSDERGSMQSSPIVPPRHTLSTSDLINDLPSMEDSDLTNAHYNPFLPMNAAYLPSSSPSPVPTPGPRTTVSQNLANNMRYAESPTDPRYKGHDMFMRRMNQCN